jgi:hypothetical protein
LDWAATQVRLEFMESQQGLSIHVNINSANPFAVTAGGDLRLLQKGGKHRGPFNNRGMTEWHGVPSLNTIASSWASDNQESVTLAGSTLGFSELCLLREAADRDLLVRNPIIIVVVEVS